MFSDYVQWPMCATFAADRHKIFTSFENVEWLFSRILYWHWKQVIILNVAPEDLRSWF